jgi:hypothetical protein
VSYLHLKLYTHTVQDSSHMQNQIKPRRIIKRVYFEIRAEPNLTQQFQLSAAKSNLKLRRLDAGASHSGDPGSIPC